MKHTFIILFTLLIAVLATAANTSSAQTGFEPNLIMPANPSPYLSDWQSQAGSIQLTASLGQSYNQPVKLMAQVTLNGQVVARTKPEKMPMLSLHQGFNSFSAVDIIPYQAVSFTGGIDQASQRAGRFPEGNYEFCVWFINAETGTAIANSPCHPFTIREVQPPQLLAPANDAAFSSGRSCTNSSQLKPITLKQLAHLDHQSIASLQGFNLISGDLQTPYIQLQSSPENIEGDPAIDGRVLRFASPAPSSTSPNNPVTGSLIFQWIPPMAASALQVQYKIRIVEVLPGQSPALALQTATPVFEQDGISSTTFSGSESMSRLFALVSAQSLFAWSVQAHDAMGMAIGNNNGWAVPNTFTIGESELAGMDIPQRFFDIFAEVEMPKEPCGLHAKAVDTKFGPWRLFKSSSQYFNIWIRNVYTVYEVIDCGLEKGHAGPHQGKTRTVYVLDHTQKENTYDVNPPPPTPPASMNDDPSKKDQMSKDDMQKILDNDKQGGGAGNNGNGDTGGTNGNGTGSGTGSGTGTNGTGKGTGTGVGGSTGKAEQCPYQYKKYIRNLYTPCKDGWSDMYGVYEIFKCTLLKGHSGPHEGTTQTVYVYGGRVGCNDNLTTEPLSSGANVMTSKDLDKIPSKQDADKAEAEEAAHDNARCPELKKTLLRTVAGSWRRVKTVVHPVSVGKHVTAFANVTWQRDIWNVYLVQQCVLERGHGGAHQWDGGHEEWSKWSTHTETDAYTVGESQVPPIHGFGDDIPQEDPPRNAIYMR